MEQLALRHLTERTKRRTLCRADGMSFEPLLVDVLREGQLVYNLPDIEEMRQRRREDVARLDAGVKRLPNPHVYHVSLTERLWNLKQELIEAARNG